MLNYLLFFIFVKLRFFPITVIFVTLQLLSYFSIQFKMEYASTIWSSFYSNYIVALEKIQRSVLIFLAFREDRIDPNFGYTYDTLFDRLLFHSLQSRRLLSEILFGYKLLNNMYECAKIIQLFKFHPTRLSARNHHLF